MAILGARQKQQADSAIRQARRQQLIEATITSISKRGFSGTTLNSVTEEAGLSHGVVNFHFDSKEALYLETLGYLADEHHAHWQAALQRAADGPAARLAAIVEADFAPAVCSRKKLSVWFAFWGQARQRPSYLNVHGHHDDKRRDIILSLCRELSGPAEERAVEPILIARNLVAVVDGLWLQMLLFPAALPRRDALRGARAFLAAHFPAQFDGEGPRARARAPSPSLEGK